MRIGSVIATIRTERGWSQDELADKAETTKTSISRIESDEQWPRPNLLDAIAQALGVKVYQIFAMAEGIFLPEKPVIYSKEEDSVISAYKAMEPEMQKHYLAMAKALAVKKK